MDIQTQGEIGGGVLVAVIGFFMRNVHGRFQRVERNYVTADKVADLIKASEERFTELVNKSEARVDVRHASTEANFRELRLLNESTNTKLFELAKQKQP